MTRMRPYHTEAKDHPHLDSRLIRTILRILENNPYVRVFRNVGQMQNLDELKIELSTSISVDQRRYNAPAIDQVASIWQDGSDERNKFKHSIMIYPNFGRPEFIRAYHGYYDLLAYHILYSGGEIGWKDKSISLEETPTIYFPQTRRKYTKRKTDDSHIAPSKRARKSGVRQKQVQPIIQTTHSAPYVCEDEEEDDRDNIMDEDGDGDGGGSHLHVSVREYYCYIMQIRNDVFNIFFHGGRLFQ
ncbi:hypothetical protein PVAP13_6KG242412 [Panicum virgatum]|uniref:Uncharacterized protein n=1 Tax=Panicum virgatum TaxID=38727 RepID=A0A8T0RBQ1_PANVG|nr:hypothetical protein PVAP13_6KG242412 [Panicum virgatum]